MPDETCSRLTRRSTVKALDKDAHPVRFALVTSAGSSLVVAAIISGIDQILNNRFLMHQFPLWVFLLLGTVGIYVTGMALHLKQNGQDTRRGGQVFLILCAFTEKRWVAGLILEVLNSLDRRGLDLVLKTPERDYVHFGQVRHLQNLKRCRRRYVGGIISPAEPELLRPDVKAFCESVSYPVVFIDIAPFEAAEDYPAGTAFVGYASEDIGRCAADYVAEHAKKSRILCPGVLVIGSKLHIGRQAEFTNRLKVRFQYVDFTIDETGSYDRARARDIVHKNLQSREYVPNYIFCTNNEMALGAVDALSIADLGNDGSVVVVGVDGIPEARALIDSQKSPLRATVVQDSCRMTEIATDLLHKAMQGNHITKLNYLDPCIYSKN